MSFENNRLFTDLKADSGILAAIDTFDSSTESNVPCIFDDNVLPDWITEEKTINFYRSTPINGGLNYGDETFIIACRAQSFAEADTIQRAVFSGLNRLTSNTDGFYICSALPIIPPADSTDNYNAPIEVRIKTK